MAPKLYGIEHIIYLVVMTVVFVLTITLTQKFAKSEKVKVIVLKAMAGFLLVSIIANRFSIVYKTDPPAWSYLIPDSYCGMSSLVLALAVLFGKKDNNIYHFVWIPAIIGGLAATFYSDFIGQNPSFFYLPTITGFLHHTVSVGVVIAIFVFNQITLSVKKWYYLPLGLCCYYALGAFLMAKFGYGDAFTMFNPVLAGTPFDAWLITPVYTLLYVIVALISNLIHKKHLKKGE